MKSLILALVALFSIGTAQAQVNSVAPFLALSNAQQAIVPITELSGSGFLLPASIVTTITVTTPPCQGGVFGCQDGLGETIVSVALEGSQIVITPVNAGGPVLVNIADGNGNHIFIPVFVVSGAIPPTTIKDTNPVGVGPYQIISNPSPAPGN